MKRFIGIAALMIIVAFMGQNSTAQNLKFGHINSDELIQQLPEFDSANVKLENFRTDLINALELMSVELNNKSNTYTKEMSKLSEIVRQNKEQELVDMQRRVQEFQTTAQQQLQDKQAELFQPIILKVNKAIEDVGKENGFIYIFNAAQGGPLLFFDQTKSTDILVLAKAKLGIK